LQFALGEISGHGQPGELFTKQGTRWKAQLQPLPLSRHARKQLTDEAAGDNPAEQRTRDEHQILPNDVRGAARCW
jgi:hypothetical protein